MFKLNEISNLPCLYNAHLLIEASSSTHNEVIGEGGRKWREQLRKKDGTPLFCSTGRGISRARRLTVRLFVRNDSL